MTPVKVPTSELVEGMPTLDAECVLVEETRWTKEDPVDKVLGRLQQPVVQPEDDAEIRELEGNDGVQVDDEASIVRQLPQPKTERKDSALDVVVTRPVPVPRKPRAESAQVDVPCPSPRRTQRSTAGVHSNPNRLPKSACNSVSFSPDVLSQVLAGIVLYTSGKLQGVVDD